MVDKALSRLAELIGQDRFEELETDTLEIKPVPAESSGWRERHKSACAFLNTRGGIILFGVKAAGAGAARKYVFTGWQPNAEPNLKEGMYPIYIADRALVRKDYVAELRRLFGLKFDGLDELHKQVLSVVYRHNTYSKKKLVSAKVASFALWYEREGAAGDIEQFDAFYRKVRYVFNRLQKDGLVEKQGGTRGYALSPAGGADALRPMPAT